MNERRLARSVQSALLAHCIAMLGCSSTLLDFGGSGASAAASGGAAAPTNGEDQATGNALGRTGHDEARAGDTPSDYFAGPPCATLTAGAESIPAVVLLLVDVSGSM